MRANEGKWEKNNNEKEWKFCSLNKARCNDLGLGR